jgi:DNA-binding MarR family transcriptional regulator
MPPDAQAVARRESHALDPAFQQLVGEVFRLNGQLLATAEELARPMGVTPAGWQTIATIRDEALTASEIGRRLGMRRQSAQHNVNRLVRQGLVELQANPGHRRAPLAALTPAGRRTMTALYRLQGELAARFTRGLALSGADLDAVAATLRHLRETALGDGPPPARRPSRRSGAQRRG